MVKAEHVQWNSWLCKAYDTCREDYDAMICTTDYSVTTPARGLVLKPHGHWDGISTYYKLEVTVKQILTMQISWI